MIIFTFRKGSYCLQWTLDFIVLLIVLLLDAALCSFAVVGFSMLL